MKKTRMTGVQRREQLVRIGRALFAERGFDAASVEELAARAEVSKPVIYEHFGGKEGLYAVIVDREVTLLTSTITEALQSSGSPRELVENTALSFLTYIETNTDGFRILLRDTPSGDEFYGTFSSLLGDVANQLEPLLADHFARVDLDTGLAPMYAQMLVGLISLCGQWWLSEREPSKEQVATNIVNLCWNGLKNLEHTPELVTVTL